MGPHFRRMVQSINTSLKKSVVEWNKELAELREETGEDVSTETVVSSFGFHKIPSRYKKDALGQFRMDPRGFQKSIQDYAEKIGSELPSILRSVKREMGSLGSASSNKERTDHLKLYAHKVVEQFEQKFPELKGILQGNAGLDSIKFSKSHQSGILMTKGVIPEFHRELSSEVVRALSSQGMTRDLYKMVNSVVSSQLDSAIGILETKAYSDASGGGKYTSFTETPEQQSARDLSNLFASPADFIVASGSFKGKSLGDIYNIIEGKSPELKAFMAENKAFQKKIKMSYDSVFLHAEKTRQRAVELYIRKARSYLVHSEDDIQQGVKKINDAYQKRINHLHGHIQNRLRTEGAALYQKHRTISRERKKAAEWILNTHAALEANPAKFSAHFVSRGYSPRPGLHSEVFTVMFQEADKKLGLVSQANTFLNTLDVTDSELEGMYVRNFFYVNKRGLRSRTQQVRYVAPKSGEGEGFAPDDVKNRRSYNPRRIVRDMTLEERRLKYKEKVGLAGKDSVFRNVLSDMDEISQQRYTRIKSVLEKVPDRPRKEVYIDPVTKELKKGYRFNAGLPLLVQTLPGGKQVYKQFDVYRKSRGFLMEDLRNLVSRTTTSKNIDIYAQMASLSEYLESDKLSKESIQDFGEAGAKGRKIAKSKKIKFRSLTDAVYGSTDESRGSYNLGEDRDDRTKEEREKDAGLHIATARNVSLALKVQAAKSHEELNKVQDVFYEEMLSSSGLSSLREPANKDAILNKKIANITELAQVFNMSMKFDPKFPEGVTAMDTPEMKALIEKAGTGEDVTGDIHNFFTEQAQSALKNNNKVNIRDYPDMPPRLMFQLKRMQLNNEGSKT